MISNTTADFGTFPLSKISAVTQHQISDFRFQISDFRSQHHPRLADRFLREISDFRFQIPEGTMAEISTGNRILNAQNTFQDFITDFCVTQISDFRSQNSQIADFRFQISDPRTPATPRHRFQISENRFQRSRATSQRWADFRFQIPQRSRPMWHLHCRFQISEYSDPPECHPGMVCQNSRCQISESRIQIPGAKKSVRVP